MVLKEIADIFFFFQCTCTRSENRYWMEVIGNTIWNLFLDGEGGGRWWRRTKKEF